MKSHIKTKQTHVGEIPEDWEVNRLIDVADYVNGYGFSPKEWSDKGLPIIRIQNLTDTNADFNYYNGEIDERYIVENGNLLFPWSASIGVHIWNGRKAVLNQHIFKVIPKKGVDKQYLYYALFLAIEQLKSRVHGSTMKHFKRGELKITLVPKPPLPEQQKIASILSTVDDAIQKVDGAIAKTERLKKGLMQRLLTRGIGHERFKETEVGRVPEEWEAMRLGNVISLEYGKGLIESQRKNGKYPVFGSNGIVGYHNEFLVIGPGIVVGRKGTIGAINWSDGNFWPIDTTYFVKPVRDDIDLRWLSYKLISLNLSKLNMATGTPGLNRDLAYSQVILLPPLSEQRRIAEILSTVDKKLELERHRKEKLERTKKGLMNELLTGRKRVK